MITVSKIFILPVTNAGLVESRYVKVAILVLFSPSLIRMGGHVPIRPICIAFVTHGCWFLLLLLLRERERKRERERE